MGSLVKCRGCGERCGQRPISVYWRWPRADHVWKKYYARICAGCYAAKVLAIDVEYPSDVRLTCPGCGIDTDDDFDQVSATAFPQKSEMISTEAPFCASCAAVYRAWVVDHADDISEGEGAPSAPSQSASARQTLKALGQQVA